MLIVCTVQKVYKELATSVMSELAVVRRSLLLAVGSLTNRLLMLTRSYKEPHQRVITLVEAVSNVSIR